ncbi:hypothetical protein [Pseudochrobactrum kiredjianiae]|uniref:Uncharacterized protein n=1 Tax=Pseudochrobactrum kiredjianiae TaxID=386305 RepID=A0ABW3V7C0_9HYPH|nr:hypothetical protein [Pseudochrobactrum kiredjianiae]MDM7850529.1 hypothetical protein [Pseudochrobactrum kiredjianiae]
MTQHIYSAGSATKLTLPVEIAISVPFEYSVNVETHKTPIMLQGKNRLAIL